jgi:hypothetical protein
MRMNKVSIGVTVTLLFSHYRARQRRRMPGPLLLKHPPRGNFYVLPFMMLKTPGFYPETNSSQKQYGKERQHETGTTVVMITHDPNIARMAQRSVRIVDGKIASFNH